MEPMTLGSPTSSSPSNPGHYLPSYLMGEPMVPTTSPRNTLSPNKGGRNLSFAISPVPNSPQDFNRSLLGQKTLFSGYQQATPAVCVNVANSSNYPGTTPISSHNASISGPPIQGLFDTLRNEQNKVQTPTRQTNPNYGTPSITQNINGAIGIQQQTQGPFNDSYSTNTSFNATRSIVSPLGPCTPNTASFNNSYMLQCPPTPRYTEFWITVYGFPSSATSIILQHFSQCGTIVDKMFPPQNGNWVHLKYSSRLECDRALNYNEKILGNNIMIGVTHCKDKNIMEKENLCENNVTQLCKVRPLTQIGYKSAQCDTAVVACPNAPQKSTGLMNKAMDLFFGW